MNDDERIKAQKQLQNIASSFAALADQLTEVSEILGTPIMTFTCPTPTNSPAQQCNQIFDCLTSVNSFAVFDDEAVTTVASEPYSCATKYIRLSWIGCDGNRVIGDTRGLQDESGGEIQFIRSEGISNIYSWKPATISGAAKLSWGNQIDLANGDDICEISLAVDCEAQPGIDGLSSTTSLPPSVDSQDLPGPGQTTTLNNGVTIQCLPGSTHQYATRSATNLDGTLYVDDDGDVWALPPVANAVPLRRVPVNSERVWSYVSPNIIYGVNLGTGTIWHVDVSDGSTIDTGIPALGIGRGEGGISGDDKYISVDTVTQISTYNLQAPFSQVGESIDIPPNYDTHKISLDGQCVFVVTRANGGDGFVYSNDMSPKSFNPVPDSDGHGVSAVDCDGNDVYVFFANPVTAVNYKTGERYAILPQGSPFTGSQWHISYSPSLPGFVTISARNSSGGGGWIGLVPVCPGNTEVIALTDGYMEASNTDDFACQAKVSAGISGKDYVFDSCDEVSGSKSYLITRPEM